MDIFSATHWERIQFIFRNNIVASGINIYKRLEEEYRERSEELALVRKEWDKYRENTKPGMGELIKYASLLYIAKKWLEFLERRIDCPLIEPNSYQHPPTVVISTVTYDGQKVSLNPKETYFKYD